METNSDNVLYNGMSREAFADRLAETLKAELKHEVCSDKEFFRQGRRVRSGIKPGYREDFVHVLKTGSDYNLIEIYVRATVIGAIVLVKAAGYESMCSVGVPYVQKYSKGYPTFTFSADSSDQLAEYLTEFLKEADFKLSNR